MKIQILASALALTSCVALSSEDTRLAPTLVIDTPSWPGCGVVESYPQAQWGPAAPRLGWNAEQLSHAEMIFEQSSADSVMVIHRGHPISAWGPVSDPLTIQSMRKPVLGAVIAQLIEQGKLDLDSSLAALDIVDSDPALTDEERQATLRDLLLVRSGIMHDANYEFGGWRKRRLAIRDQMTEPTRGVWFYNNWDFNVLGTIASRAGDADLGKLVDEYVAQPLGMQDYSPEMTSYSGRDSRAQQHFGYGSDYPAYMFEVSTRDMARFGLLYLGCGEWDGEQIISSEWVEESLTGIDTYLGSSNDLTTGMDQYGYLWWIENGGEYPRLPELKEIQPFYAASGSRGHYMLVLPKYDLVIVHQPRTVGGISDAAQMARAQHGSPEVTPPEFQELVIAILKAHPKQNDDNKNND